MDLFHVGAVVLVEVVMVVGLGSLDVRLERKVEKGSVERGAAARDGRYLFVADGAAVLEQFVGGGQVELGGGGRGRVLEEAAARLERARRVQRAVGYVEQLVLEYGRMVRVVVEVRVECVRAGVVGVGVGAQAAVRRVLVEVGLGEPVRKAVGQLLGGVGERIGQLVAQPQSFDLLVDA